MPRAAVAIAEPPAPFAMENVAEIRMRLKKAQHNVQLATDLVERTKDECDDLAQRAAAAEIPAARTAYTSAGARAEEALLAAKAELRMHERAVALIRAELKPFEERQPESERRRGKWREHRARALDLLDELSTALATAADTARRMHAARNAARGEMNVSAVPIEDPFYDDVSDPLAGLVTLAIENAFVGLQSPHARSGMAPPDDIDLRAFAEISVPDLAPAWADQFE